MQEQRHHGHHKHKQVREPLVGVVVSGTITQLRHGGIQLSHDGLQVRNGVGHHHSPRFNDVGSRLASKLDVVEGERVFGHLPQEGLHGGLICQVEGRFEEREFILRDVGVLLIEGRAVVDLHGVDGGADGILIDDGKEDLIERAHDFEQLQHILVVVGQGIVHRETGLRAVIGVVHVIEVRKAIHLLVDRVEEVARILRILTTHNSHCKMMWDIRYLGS